MEGSRPARRSQALENPFLLIRGGTTCFYPLASLRVAMLSIENEPRDIDSGLVLGQAGDMV